MRIRSLSLALGALIMAAAPVSAQDADPVRCSVAKSESRGLVELTGQVWSRAKLNGTYEFIIDKRGGGGTSAITQGGAFEVAAGKATNLGTARIDSGARFEARLIVRWPGGKQECVVDETTVATAPKPGDGTKANRSTVSSSGGNNVAVTVQRGGSNSSVITQSN